MKNKPVFIEAHFELSDTLAAQIAKMTGARKEEVQTALVKRDLDGKYQFGFPLAVPDRHVSKPDVVQLVSEAQAEISTLSASKTEEGLKSEILEALNKALNQVSEAPDDIDAVTLEEIKDTLDTVDTENALKRSTVVPRFGQVVDAIDEMFAKITTPHPQDNDKARTLIKNNLPAFVYYLGGVLFY